MSRRRAWADPSDAPLADFEAMQFGERTYRDAGRPMPGCHERCCFPALCQGRLPAALTVQRERLEWMVSGADLVPILSMVLCILAALSTVLRIGGAL